VCRSPGPVQNGVTNRYTSETSFRCVGFQSRFHS
jgi:hypothetical protein